MSQTINAQFGSHCFRDKNFCVSWFIHHAIATFEERFHSFRVIFTCTSKELTFVPEVVLKTSAGVSRCVQVSGQTELQA